MVGAGAVVTADVPDFALVVGVPARRIGWIGRSGERFGARGRGRLALPGDRRALPRDGRRQRHRGRRAREQPEGDTGRAAGDRRRGDRGRRPRAAQRHASCRAPRWPRSRTSSPSWSTAGTASRSTPAPRRCSSRCWRSASARATRSSCPSFSFAATANAVRLAGADAGLRRHRARTPSASTRTRSAAAIGPRTVGDHAGAPVRSPGRHGPARCALAERHGLAVVEDAAQAHGAALGGTPVGAFGQAGCFSFYPTKNMHALEGGMITTADAELARTAAAAAQPGHGAALRQRDRRRQHAADRRRRGDRPGAARASSPAGPSSGGPTRRSSTPDLTGRVPRPPVADGARHVYHQYTVRVAEGRRDALQAQLTRRRRRQRRLLPDADPPAARRSPRLRPSDCRPAGDRPRGRRGALAAGPPDR